MVGYDPQLIYARISELLQRGGEAMLVTVVDKQGSTPALPGTKLLMQAGGNPLGTVGGGALEHLAIEKALQLLGQRTSLLLRYSLTEGDQVIDGEATGMVCGGRVALFYEYLGHATRVVIYGAGHVGQAVARWLSRLQCYVAVVDPRPEMLAQLQGANRALQSGFEQAFQGETMPEGGYYIIATPGHESDYEVLKRIYSSGWAPRYVGMVASKRKAATFVQKLREELGENLDLGALYTPVGLDLGGSTPDEVALSIVSEMQALRNDKAGHCHMRANQ
jgi:xanthine dehydrogenase accessory factor